MRKFKTCRPRALPFRLLVLAASALLFTAAFTPRADAQTNPPGSTVVAYFNFDNPHTGPAIVDKTPDLIPGVTQVGGSGIVGDNPGGGHEMTVTDLTISGNPTLVDAPQLANNRTTGDNDPDAALPAGSAIGVRRTASNPSFTISFGVNTQFYAGLSLSFAVNNAGNGYHNVQLSWTGADTGSLPVQTNTTGTITFTLPPSVNGNGNTFKFITFTLTFTNGQSNGNNANESIFDNIQLTATTVVPEPATVWGGLLGVLGLCWFQRRRIRLILPRLRRT